MRRIERDSVAHLWSVGHDHLRSRYFTLLTRMSAQWWMIDLGPACTFYGTPILRRHPGSTMRIGPRCSFRSAEWSNLVGLTRRCMLSTLHEGAELIVGERCGFSATVIGAAQRIVIGNEVLCGANVTITDHDWHAIDASERRAGVPPRPAPVTIEDGVWLSMNVTVLKGVTIGAGSVVAAGSVVSKSIPAGVIAAGSPAKVVKKLAG